jgi:hypothetical protein
MDAASDPRCDQGHLGPAFATFHRALVLQFEESLLAVDPRIPALPYWDYNLDSAHGADPRRSVLWTDAWFGASVGDPMQGHAVVDGYFYRQGWRVRAHAQDISQRFNTFGFLRAPWNNNTRHAHPLLPLILFRLHLFASQIVVHDVVLVCFASMFQSVHHTL